MASNPPSPTRRSRNRETHRQSSAGLKEQKSTLVNAKIFAVHVEKKIFAEDLNKLDQLDLESRLLECFVPRRVEPHFGNQFLRLAIKSTVAVPPSELALYALDTDIKLNGSNYGLRFKKKYFDTTFNFCLTYDDALIATLGFEIDENVLIVWQIQGVKGQGERLQPFKWSQALLRYCVGWAGAIGVTEVNVVSVKHNRWSATHGHLNKNRGKLIYDVTAKRCGFKKNADGYYRLKLPQGHHPCGKKDPNTNNSRV